MDKFEYRIKTEQMVKYLDEKSYKKAMEIADSVNWKKVSSVAMLSSVSEIYEKNREYQKSRDVLFMAYDRAPGSKKIIYRLGETAILLGDTTEAIDSYEEFCKVAPKDPNQYILRYQILKMQRAPKREQIEALEALKKAEYIEKWSYELAKLYHEAGMKKECIEECDDLALWFSEGKYVYRAMELKMLYKPLTAMQQERYEKQKGEMQRSSIFQVPKEPVTINEKETNKDTHDANTVDINITGKKEIKKEANIGINEKPVITEESELQSKIDGLAEIENTKTETIKAEDLGDTKVILRDLVEKALKTEAIFIQPQEKEEEAMNREDQELIATGQMKIDAILKEWENKQKENAALIQEKQKELEKQENELVAEPTSSEGSLVPNDIRELMESLENGTEEELDDDNDIEEYEAEELEVETSTKNMADVVESLKLDDLDISDDLDDVYESDNDEPEDDASEEDNEVEEDEYEEGNDEVEEDDEYEEDEYEDDEYEDDEYEDDEYEDDEYEDDEYEDDEYEDDEYEDDEYEDDEYEEDEYEDDEYEDDEYEDDEYEDDEYEDDEYEDDEVEEDDEYEDDEYEEDEYEEDEYEEDNEVEEDDNEVIEKMEEETVEVDGNVTEEAEDVLELPTEKQPKKKEKRGNVSKGGVSFDTGFVVQGRYDLSATSEIGLQVGLTEEQKKLFSYFVPIRGVSEQIVDVLENDKRGKKKNGTSKSGNILVVGRQGTGKTVLAVNIVKAIQKQRQAKQGRVAIVTGEALNKKELAGIIPKLNGGAIIIEKAGKLNARTIRELNELMEGKTNELLIILEEQRKGIEKMMAAHPEFKKKFTSRIELPVFINDELVTFGQTYAKEMGYRIDDMGILALYSRIDIMQREDHAVTVAEVKNIIDEAIHHSQKGNVKHLVKRVFGKNTDEGERVILTEEDFK